MKLYFVLLVILSAVGAASGQQKIGYVDSEYIYSRYPDFASAQQSLDRLSAQMEQDLAQEQENLDAMFREYQARELLYTHDERQRKREEIVAAEVELENLRSQYFGPEGELYRQQEQILRPIQEKILAAIEEIASAEGYDYVFDRGGDYLFLYTEERHNLSVQVLDGLGIVVELDQ